MTSKQEILSSKKQLDFFINKQRVALYKPIQIAEILFRIRKGELKLTDIRDNLESYRNPSKRWRDEISTLLIDRVSTSSQKFQDNIFESNAIHPSVLLILGEENLKKNGVVEKYIYLRFRERQDRIISLTKIIEKTEANQFQLESFLGEFVRDSHIKRSIDKAYEIVIYALFNTLVKHLNAQITISTDPTKKEILKEFEEFSKLVLGVDSTNPTYTVAAKIFRGGVTNAADRGLDMWANFGPAIQVKHLDLSLEEAENVCGGIAADDIIIVCNDCDRRTIESIMNQLGQRIRGIIVKSQLISWYNLALRGHYASLLADDLMENLKQEFINEFPYSTNFVPFFKGRKYDKIPDDPENIWCID